MSTVSKEVADRVVAGEFPEDGILAIVQYRNIFSDEPSFKLFSPRNINLLEPALAGDIPTMLDCRLYWQA